MSKTMKKPGSYNKKGAGKKRSCLQPCLVIAPQNMDCWRVMTASGRTPNNAAAAIIVAVSRSNAA